MEGEKLEAVNEDLAKLLRPFLRDDSAPKYSSSCYAEARKLETKIQDWAANLGFCLPNGSAPPPNYFSSLTATPHRRQLWEVIVESVQSRKKVERMRKQLLAFNLKSGNKNAAYSSSSNFLSKIYFWTKQNELEAKINEEKRTSAELEKNILAGTSDLLFDACRLQDLEKQCEEYKEKAVILKLFNKREKSYIKELETLLLNIKDAYRMILTKKSDNEILLKDNLSRIEDKIANSEACEDNRNFYHNCRIQNKIQHFLESGETEADLWEKVLNLKKTLLGQFSVFLEELSTSEKDFVLEKKIVLEKILNSSMTKLKKEVTLKSLEIMINEADRNILHSEIEKLTASVDALLFKGFSDKSLTENLSYLTAEVGDSFSGETESSSRLKNYLANVEMKSYHKFLKAELSRLENESLRKKEYQNEFCDSAEEILEKNSSLAKSICDEINIFTSKQEEQKKEIIQLQSKIQELLIEIDCKVKDKDFVNTVEETVDNLKRDSEKLVNTFLEIPLEAFRIVDNASDEESFACKSLPGSLSEGELNQFLKSMLISYQNTGSVLEEIEKRKKIVTDFKKFISERERLSEAQKEVFSQLKSIPHDSKACEKFFKDSETILLNALRKANELYSAFESVPKILEKWGRQPYRLMISDTETVGGMTLKEYEKIYEKIKSETGS